MNARPKLLDAFCCQGGAARGYDRAGFDVYGVDIDAQPRYPYPFHRGDALEAMRRLLAGEAIDFVHPDGTVEWLTLTDFDAIHASPPCTDHTTLKSRTADHGTGWLLEATLELLPQVATTWVVENVMGADMPTDMVLCGSMFGLRVYRHRRFRIAGPTLLQLPPHPRHRVKTSTKKRRRDWEAGLNISVTGDIGTSIGGPAMGIDWMTGDGLSQAIPPAYTEWVGRQLIAHLKESVA